MWIVRPLLSSNRYPSGFSVSTFFLLITVLSLAVASLSHAAPTVPVGATAGSFVVDANGGATYTIPIQVPPGTAGFAPNLTLSYDKQVDSGLAGLGWSISGLSIITRCPKTIVLDGAKGGVNYDSNDRFCLNGQRLVAINNGVYGVDQTEYRTERESFSRIISYGVAGSGPQSFKVWSPSGSIMEYGVTNDARIEAAPKNGVAQTTVRLWALNKVQDRAGNYFTISYVKDNANGEYRPTRIDYTGNVAGGLMPYNSVQFVYAARPDALSRFEAGSVIKTTQRIINVKAFAGSSLVRDYRLAYDNNGGAGSNNSGIAGLSRLINVTECGADGVCLLPTTFNWQNESVGVTNFTVAGGHGIGDGGWAMADLFGDGRQVYYSHNTDGTHRATRLNPDSTLQNWFWNGGHGISNEGWAMADLFGDARQVYYTHNSDGAHYATRLNPDGTLQNWTWTGGHGKSDGGWAMADLFGDGRQVYYTHGSNWVHYATRLNPDGTLQNWTWTDGRRVSDGGWAMADLFGDGRQVFYTHSSDGTHAATRLNPDGTLQNWTWTGGHGIANDGWAMADLFGDGRQVYYSHNIDGTHYATRLNPDGTLQNWTWTGGLGNGGEGWAMVDLFGDGRQVYYTHSSDGRHYATRLNPDGSLQNWTWTGGHGVGNGSWAIADLFGDGRQVYYTHNTDGTQMATRISSGRPGLLTSITTGIGARTAITYAPITNNTLYTKDSVGSYPYQNIQNATYVVSRYAVSDGIGGERGANYKYAGAKVHLQGGGWLGFREIAITDERSGIVTTTQYNQVYNGTQNLPAHSETRVGTSLLSSQDSFWSATTFPTGAQKYAKLDGTLVQNFDLNGSLATCAQVNNTYGSYGSVTEIVAKTDTTCSFTNAFTKTTASTYSHDPDKWILGQVLRTTVRSEAPGQTAQTRTVAYTYSPVTGYVASDITEPDFGAFRVTTAYTYDGFGNKTRVEVSGADFPTRASTSTYDARGQFPVSSSNALSQNEARVFDPKWGVVTSSTGPNGFIAISDYDGFGRLVSRTSADGKTATTTLALCDVSDVNCPSLAKTKVTMTIAGGGTTLPSSTVYGDILGRTLRTRSTGFDGRLIFQDTEYNNLGQVARTSLPYFRCLITVVTPGAGPYRDTMRSVA